MNPMLQVPLQYCDLAEARRPWTSCRPRKSGLWLAWFCLLLLAAMSQGRAQGPGKPHPHDPIVGTGSTDASLNDLAILTEDVVVAVGDRGAIVSTDNGGRTWKMLPSGTTANLYGIAASGERLGLAVGGWIGNYTGMSHGVVLRTSDGGDQWQAVPCELPRLTGVTSAAGRWIAWGDYSTRLKCCVFESLDDGLTWHGLPCKLSHATAGAITNDGHVAAVDQLGRSYFSAAPHASALIASSARPLYALHHTGDIWLGCGESGELIGSVDGKTWIDVPLPLSAPAREQCVWRTIAQVGDEVWVGGLPGSILLQSNDRGRSWRVRPTGETIPIHAVGFVDQHRGWACGPMGLILATRDAGATWYPQRQSTQRLGVFAFAETQEDFPWSPLVAATWDGLVNSAGMVMSGDDPVTYADFLPARSVCLQAAAAQLALASHSTSRAPSEDPSVRARRLATQLQSWRPDVVIVSETRAEGPQQGALLRAALEALSLCTVENDAVSHELHLPTWSVSKLVSVCDGGASEFSEQSGRILRGPGLALWDFLQALPPDQRTMAGKTFMRVDRSQSQAGAVSASLLGGIAPSQETRRAIDVNNIGNYQTVMGRVHLEKSLEQLLQQHHRESNLERWGSDLAFILQSVPERDLPATLYGLLEKLDTPATALQQNIVLSHMISLRDGFDIADWARLRQLRWLQSEELAAWRNTLDSHTAAENARDVRSQTTLNAPFSPTSGPAALGGWSDSPFNSLATGDSSASSSMVVTASATSAVQPYSASQVGDPVSGDPVSGDPVSGDPVSGADWLQLYESVHRASPSLTSRPDVELLAFRTKMRSRPQAPLDHTIHLDRVLQADQLVGWPQMARQEFALLRNQVDQLRWSTLAVYTTRQPMLDGQLNDSFWKTTQAMELTDWQSPPAPPVELRWAYDESYLYVGIACKRHASDHPVPLTSHRKYDSDLAGTDHVELLLDTDRDYNALVTLAVAEDGRTYDRCADSRTYNPKWHVAVAGDEQWWTAEVAISLDALTQQKSELRGEAWAISARRRHPSGRHQSWGQLRSHGACPQAAGLLLLGGPL